MQQMISVTTHTLSDVLTYQNEAILTYKIEFPQFSSLIYQKAMQRINAYYQGQAEALKRYIYRTLYFQAVENYQYAKKNGYPVMVFEVQQAYRITHMANHDISLYTDQYTYTGGAHGSTVRTSQTWGLPRGYKIPLKALFPPRFPYRAYLIHKIIQEIERQNASGDSVYFDDYKENVQNTFDENNFYLIPEGIVIYFQQYDIAPYSTGIPEFLIPYPIKS